MTSRRLPEVTGAQILLLVRDNVATDLPSLCSAFGVALADAYVVNYVDQHVRALLSAGLIVDAGAGKFRVSETWVGIQSALGIGLTDAAALRRRTIVVEPYWGPPHPVVEPIDVFVVMPFDAGLTPIWEEHIKRVASKLSLAARRADDFFSSGAVMDDIWNGIYGARVVVADCTGRNPNVFYEIGVAHAVGKNVVLVTQNGDDVPFDLRFLRYIQYTYTPPGMRKFEKELAETLRNAIAKGN